MKRIGTCLTIVHILAVPLLITSCSTTTVTSRDYPGNSVAYKRTAVVQSAYTARLPATVAAGEKTILVDPNVHAWGAYGSDGNLIRAGLATAGNSFCTDTGRACYTSSGTFRIQSLGSAGCKSRSFPLPHGGAPMPYCMYFTRAQALHGSYQVVEGNISHGCVRMRVSDAAWLRFNFANVGTKVIVRPY